MTLKAILHKEDGGYWAEVPALKGCYSQGKTVKEVKANLAEAVQGYIETLQEQTDFKANGSRDKQKGHTRVFEVAV